MPIEPRPLPARTKPIPLRPIPVREAARLPVPLSNLVGRKRDIAAVVALLRDPAVRLATMTGPGGVGKTRLALAVATEVAFAFADGAIFVDLASIRDADLVMPAIAQALGVRPRGDEPAEAAVQGFLRDSELLLVLDNFEQVVLAGPRVADLLRSCAFLKVLVTSRALLHVSGEQAVPVLPLSLPPARREGENVGAARRMSPERAASAPALLLASDAVRLFVDRSRAVRPEFALLETNATDVAEICRRLDGLPLAIELAAARAQLFPPAALLVRLDSRLPQLAQGQRDLPERLRTMRNAIAWSYDLLSPEEQEVFRGLGAFVGGCTLDAAEAVCGSPQVRDVVAAVESLTSQSLVRMVERPDGSDAGAPRLIMLETVREFALERLNDSGAHDVLRRHASYFRELAERVELTHWGDAPGDLRDLMRPEVGNMRAAVNWAIEQRDIETALQLATAMFDPQSVTGPNAREQQTWLRRALALPGGSPASRARGLVSRASLAAILDNLIEATELAEEALAIALQHDAKQEIAAASNILGVIALHSGESARAKPYLQDAVTNYRALNARGRMAGTLLALAVVEGRDAAAEGDIGLANVAAICAEALAIFRDLDHRPGVAAALLHLAANAHKRHDLPLALATLHEVLVMEWADGHPVYSYLEVIADVAGTFGRADVAARLYGAATMQRERAGRPIDPAFRAEHDQGVDVARRLLGDAPFENAFAAGSALTPEQAVAEALALTIPDPVPASITLSRREVEILPLLAAGRSNREIAEALYLSVRTIDRHVGSLFATLGVHSRAAAVQAARTAGLLQADVPPTPAEQPHDSGA